ncbi:MAG: hypothetical protein MI741_21670 [Rhodospirillales bacterium]|nr:hypothetical protein [Rhodospirillales bacterium]
MSTVKTAVVAAVVLVMSGCTFLPEATVANTATVIGSDKTFADHVISLASGKNCSTVRVERGLEYCEEDEVIPKPDVYCYRELGGVTCYEKPDMRRGDKGRLGNNDHNLVEK